MTKEKGECRKLRRGVVGELATSFPSVKARLNFSAMGRMQTKMESCPYNCSCCWARRKESKMGSKHATQTFGTQQCLLRALALEEVAWGLFHYSWHPLSLATACFASAQGQFWVTQKMAAHNQSWTSTSFLSIMHLKNHLNLFHIIKLICDFVWKFQNHS